MGLFPCRRGQLGRGGRVRKEWDRGRETGCGYGGDGQEASRVGPCCLVVQKKESLGWREDPGSGGAKHLFPASSPDRRAPCLFLFKERGRPTSLPRAYLCCFLIFQSSDFTALCVCVCVFGSNKVPQQQEEPFPLPDPQLGTRQMGRGLPCPLQATQGWIGAHTRAAAVVAPAAPPLTASRPRGQQEEVGFGEHGRGPEIEREPGRERGCGGWAGARSVAMDGGPTGFLWFAPVMSFHT